MSFADRLGAALAADDDGPVVFLEGSGLGDGLPLVRPGETAVAAMLEGRDPDGEAAGAAVPLAFAVPTWWDLATCAVLAGCRVGDVALVAAAVDAAADPTFNLLGVQATTGAAAPLVVVAGGAVARFGLNAGTNALGPGWRANATVGRAIRLALQGVGNSVPGEGDMATHGQPGKLSWLVAENRTHDPWAEDPAPDRVTVFAGVGNIEVVLPSTEPGEVADRLGDVMAGVGAPDDVVLLPPESAGFLDRHGWDRPRLREALAARTGTEPLVVVTGGTGLKATVVPGWGGGSQRVTRSVG